ncbi:MAG: YkgJ family cysteine cluster protein [Chitinophagaceae bacterium]|uniref:YkgJ family cysteine cluster protein n=1 Tax=Rurimicrobium arvi TaxID=2049916 RepID=A0ABP8MRQ5_9BACT
MSFDLSPNWQQQSAEQQKAFRRLLEKGNKNAILKRLPHLHEAAFEKVDCLSCAHCCKNYSPRFKQPDIKRLAKALRMKEGDFTQRYLRLDEENDYVVKSAPCPFLGEDNFCSVYEDRPSDCRRFPYTDEDVLLKRIPLTLKNATFCPAVYLVLNALQQELG